ncbi:MAG TPA: hypothetical protein VE954_22750 [Oligoflexus sp.]|uniref:hypothetical protein n=1 Tax=Oligoflexus sp. TaxID=1971216 RepID=UPI002D40E443|nr:hypothetical protein [Oligoflexus sp.]HYX35930.1 hypothetical protein [Oligoflexus sp.]
MQTLSMYLSILSLSMSVGACFKMPIQSKGSVSVLDGSARPLEATQVSDVKSMATIDPAAKTAQMIAAPTSGDLSGSSVTFPPGALGISTDMIIEKASDFSQTTLFQELDLDQDVNVTSVGSGLIIRPTESASLTMPMVINMPIPVAASLQLQSNQNLTVFYKQFVGDSLISGVIPGQNITVNADGTCSFEGYFGVYWVALVSVPIVTAKTVKTEEPIINAQNVSVVDVKGVVSETSILVTMVIPEVSWQVPAISLDAISRKVTLKSNPLNNAVIKACKADFFTSTSAFSGWTVEAGATASATHLITKKEAHKLLGRFRCLDVQGRSTVSSWSPAIAIPALELPTWAVASLNPIIARQGDIVSITGTNFRTGIKLAYIGREMTKVTIKSDTLLTVVMDDAPRRGVGKLALTQDGVERSLNLAYAGTSSDFPLMTAAVSDVCAGQRFYDANGDLLEGTKNCSGVSGIPVCTGDGQINCATSASYPAALLSGLAAKVVSGQTVAGITGTAAAESHTNCVADGALGCLTTPAYPAAAATGLPSKVRAGATVAGIAGNVALPAKTHVYSGVAYGVGGNALIGQLILPSPSLVAASFGAYGIGGTGSTPTLADCSSNNTMGCITTSSWRSADWSTIIAGNIKSGATVAGVTGQYPSGAYPLNGSTGINDLTYATLHAQLKSPAAFEWFDSTGATYSATGDPDINGAYIMGGVDIYGTTGSIGNCTADGQTGCMTTSTYRSVNIAALSPWDIRAGKYAGGLAGQLPASCQNRINSTLFNMDGAAVNAAVTSGSSLDRWDTIDDLNGNMDMLPTAFINMFGPDSFCSASAGTWTDVTGDGTCDSTVDDCVFYDRITQVYWSESYPALSAAPAITGSTWSAAVTRCENLTFGSFNDWRLPTQHDLTQGMLHGLRDLGFKGGGIGISSNNSYFITNVDDHYFWSSTTASTSSISA